MKKASFVILVAFLSLTGCDDSKLAKQMEEGAEISKKMAGDVKDVPRVIVSPDSNQEDRK